MAKSVSPLQSIEGTVYGAALNDRRFRAEMAGRFAEAPYKQAPLAPVLYIKPRNTHLAHGGIVALPSDVPEIEPAAAIAVVFGENATVAGYTLALDLSEPTDSYYRPAISEKCRDGFLPFGPNLVELNDPAALEVRLEIDGKAAGSLPLRELVRPIPQLIADISAFMTFRRGDVLLTGLTPPGARAKAGSRLSAVAEGLGRLDCSLVAEALL
jgi:5-oxopent-3-ene-1,2,5-tricarboxylate decarboxylase/2-hydroxyhepta-2,4-diene-1,7-dioate isomerase